jgi:hypothetical protein
MTGGGTYVKSTGDLAVPAGVVTVTGTVPVPGGDTADTTSPNTGLSTTEVGETDCVPNITAVAPAKCPPMSNTEVPPVVGPDHGSMPCTVGAGARPNAMEMEPLPAELALPNVPPDELEMNDDPPPPPPPAEQSNE